ncbi:protein-glutamine gamma-glutamyltransferase 5 [Tautogolabrus adspersus]
MDLHCYTNNTAHRTSEISMEKLIVRRGQSFTLTLKLMEAFQPDKDPLVIETFTGNYTSEKQGTICYLSIPDGAQKRSPEAKAVWKIELDKKSSPETGVLVLTVTPPKDWVFLDDEEQRQEYVMNENGIIFYGNADHINPGHWDYGQFEENMVEICLSLLELNHKHEEDPADDTSARCNPIYVGRVISAMINSEDDHGVLEGNWSGWFEDGHRPGHWTGSSAILTQWLEEKFQPVKYGQCWVFAGVMCSVMRFFGIPCRVVTNFQSAHDNNANLTIDRYHSEDGLVGKESIDSIWNFHVWVEGWMRRPDLSEDGEYDGWQVLDPTPQEESDNVYCCGPCPLAAILKGHTNIKYDCPFVFAEVNSDVVDWLVKPDGSLEKIEADTKTVGKNISTKAVGSDERVDITDTYKAKEGSRAERTVFRKAVFRHYKNLNKMREEEKKHTNEETEGNGMPNGTGNESTEETGGETPEVIPPPPKVSIQFLEVSKLINGKDVSWKLVLSSESTADRPLIINIAVQAMNYNGHLAGNIHSEVMEKTLLPGKDLTIPIVVPFSVYCKPMLQCDSMKISALIKDKEKPDHPYLGEVDVVLIDPPISVTIPGDVKLNTHTNAEIVFMNPVNEVLKDCTVTISGTGLWKKEFEVK